MWGYLEEKTVNLGEIREKRGKKSKKIRRTSGPPGKVLYTTRIISSWHSAVYSDFVP